MRKKHKCKPLRYCTCYELALEPEDTCYIHGYISHTERCSCGRWVKAPIERDRTIWAASTTLSVSG